MVRGAAEELITSKEFIDAVDENLTKRPDTIFFWVSLRGRNTKVTERTQNADFSQKTADFRRFTPEILEIQAFRGRRKPQKTTDSRREPKIFAENRRKQQIGLRHLRSVTFSSSLFFQTLP